MAFILLINTLKIRNKLPISDFDTEVTQFNNQNSLLLNIIYSYTFKYITALKCLAVEY